MTINNYRVYQHGLIWCGAPHIEQELSVKDCLVLLSCHKKALFIRNIYDFDCKEPTSFWYIIQDKPIYLENLHSKCRNQVRKSYKELNFRIIDNYRGCLNELFQVYSSAFERYKIKTTPMSIEQYSNYLSTLSKSVSFWGAFEKTTDKLVAYAEVLIQSNSAKYTALKAIPEYMNKTYPFYGLLFEMNKYYIEEKKMLYVTDGARSITEHSNIQSFLEKFNFRRAYCHLRVTYVWWLKTVINILYPFRKLFGNSKLGYLLRFEAINRNEY